MFLQSSLLDRFHRVVRFQFWRLQPRCEKLVLGSHHHQLSSHVSWINRLLRLLLIGMQANPLWAHAPICVLVSSLRHVTSKRAFIQHYLAYFFPNRVFFAWICYGFSLWGEQSVDEDEVTSFELTLTLVLFHQEQCRPLHIGMKVILCLQIWAIGFCMIAMCVTFCILGCVLVAALKMEEGGGPSRAPNNFGNSYNPNNHLEAEKPTAME